MSGAGGARGSRLVDLHRRLEILAAAFAIAALVVMLSGAEPAPAQAPAPGFATGPATAVEPAQPPDASTGAIAANGGPAPFRDAEPLRIDAARATPSRIFLGSRRAAAFGFELDGGSARELLVKVVGTSSREVVRRLRIGRVAPGDRQRVSWDGRLAKGGFAPEGAYAFRVFSEGERAAVSRDSATQRFGFYGHRFPLLGRHTYGDGFGAGRDHQGQDLFAACGTRVVAARGGRVQARSFHSAAGYYLVVDGRGTGQDYAYMHLERGDRPPEGSWVSTGELIGRESDTGNASGCHLHFELWSAPGWYEGGHAKPPTAALNRWDGWS